MTVAPATYPPPRAKEHIHCGSISGGYPFATLQPLFTSFHPFNALPPFFSRITSKFIQVYQTLLYPFAEICLFFLRPLILYGFSASFRIFFPCVCSVTIESEPLWRLGMIKIIKLFQIPKPYLACRHPFLRNPSVLTVSLNSIVIDICGPGIPQTLFISMGALHMGPIVRR